MNLEEQRTSTWNLLRTRPQLSDKAIAEIVGFTERTVKKYRRDLAHGRHADDPGKCPAHRRAPTTAPTQMGSAEWEAPSLPAPAEEDPRTLRPRDGQVRDFNRMPSARAMHSAGSTELLAAEEQIRFLQAENRELTEYADLGREVAEDPRTFAIRHIAMTLGTTAVRLNKFLADVQVFYRHGRGWYTRTEYTGTGHFKTVLYKTRVGELSDHVRAYGKGVALIHKLWREHSEAWTRERRYRLSEKARRARPFHRKRRQRAG